MTLDEAWAEAEELVRRLAKRGRGYFSLYLALDGPGYVARWRHLNAWSVDDPEMTDDYDTPATPAKAMARLVVQLKEELDATTQSADR